MITALVALVAVAALAAAAWLGMRVQAARREAYIRTYMFPQGLIDRLVKRRPGLPLKERQLAARALRQFFLAYLKGRHRTVAMPSQVVDDLWHEFILYTKAYEQFCARAFGRFLHHAPAAVLGGDRASNEGLRRVWWWTCLEENINPRRPTRLPLLFALDGKLSIADGFRYVLDCGKVRRRDGRSDIHCASDFGSGDVDGSTSGFGDSSSGSSGGSGAGGYGGHGGAAGGAGASAGFAASEATGAADSGAADAGGDSGGGGCSGGCGGGGE